MLLMIDNYDSFTYNLVQYFGELGQDVKVFRNDEITIEEARKLKPEYLVISPGPCAPKQAGISLEIIKEFRAESADSWSVSRSSSYWRGFWRKYSESSKTYAWQIIKNSAQL